MALPRNKLIPVLALVATLIVGTILYQKFKGGPVRAGPGLAAPIDATTAPLADSDTPQDTLRSVVASNTELRRQTQELIKENDRLRKYGGMTEEALGRVVQAHLADQLAKQGKAGGPAAQAANTATTPGNVDDLGLGTPVTPPAAVADAKGATGRPAKPGVLDRVGGSINDAITNAGTLIDGLKQRQSVNVADGARSAGLSGGNARVSGAPQGVPSGLGFDEEAEAPRVVAYKLVAPLGYTVNDKAGPKQAGLVRTSLGDSQLMASRSAGGFDPAAEIAANPPAAGAGPAGEPEDEPYFTMPQNATLTRVSTMTSLIGRVPIDGRVTDPMQFKVIIGRENLAANGHQVPDEVSGIVASGVAVGDMAMSCSEGKIYSLTFVFEDGTLHTVNAGRTGGSSGGASPAANAGGSGAFAGRPPLGYISDLWGNPCIAGKFVTNAPSYLTDIVGLRSLGLASRAYAAAQTTTTTNPVTGGDSTAVTGSRGAYVLGQAAAGATDEVTAWVLSRLRNSFDAVVTPAGQKIVVHLDQQVAIDKAPQGRRLDHRRTFKSARVSGIGAQHGLD